MSVLITALLNWATFEKVFYVTVEYILRADLFFIVTITCFMNLKDDYRNVLNALFYYMVSWYR